MEQFISGSGLFSGSNLTQIFPAQPFFSIVSYLLEHFLIHTEFLSDVTKYIFQCQASPKGAAVCCGHKQARDSRVSCQDIHHKVGQQLVYKCKPFFTVKALLHVVQHAVRVTMSKDTIAATFTWSGVLISSFVSGSQFL